MARPLAPQHPARIPLVSLEVKSSAPIAFSKIVPTQSLFAANPNMKPEIEIDGNCVTVAMQSCVTDHDM
jgi:hypothetical protein